MWFHSEEPNLTCDDLCVRVGPYGTRPAGVRNIENTWQANCKLPLGLAPGWHDVSIALRDSKFSSPARIPVDLAREARVERAAEGTFKIEIVCDGRTWERKQVRAGLGASVSAWVSGLPDGIRRSDASFRLDGTDLPASFVTAVDCESGEEQGMKQINAMIPAGLERGEYQLTVRFRGEESPVIKIELF